MTSIVQIEVQSIFDDDMTSEPRPLPETLLYTFTSDVGEVVRRVWDDLPAAARREYELREKERLEKEASKWTSELEVRRQTLRYHRSAPSLYLPALP